MSLLGRVFAAAVGKSGQLDLSYADSPAGWFIDWLGGGRKTVSGERVTWKSSLELAAVYACINVRSSDVGKCPTILYSRSPDGYGKLRAVQHPAYDLIYCKPNPRMTALEFKRMLQAQVDLHGNAYTFKQRNRPGGRVIALWPLPSEYVQVLESTDGELFYRVAVPNTDEVTVPADDISHRRGLSLNGKVGLSPIAFHRETLGIAMAAEKYGAAFFGNSAQPNGALKIPTALSKEAADALRTSWEQRYQGSGNSNKLAIFDGGMDWTQTGMKNTDAQYLETRKFQNRDIYRMFRMPPHKVGDLDNATFSNIEQQSIEYVVDCLLTETTAWDQTWTRDLLTDAERKTMFFETNTDALRRGDFKSTMEGFAIARSWGIYSANDCRDKMNENRIEEDGDIYLQPLNMVPAGAPVKDSTGAPQEDGGAPDGQAPPEDPEAAVSAAEKLYNHAKYILAQAQARAASQPPATES